MLAIIDKKELFSQAIEAKIHIREGVIRVYLCSKEERQKKSVGTEAKLSKLPIRTNQQLVS